MEIIAIGFVDIAISLAVCILNVIEIIVLSRLPRKLKIYEIVLFSLSIADFLFGLSKLCIVVVYLSKPSNVKVFEITHTIAAHFILTSFLHLSLIATDRMWAIYKPLSHNVKMTRKRTFKVIAVIWVLTTTLSLALLLVNNLTELFRIKNSEGTLKSDFRFREILEYFLASFIVVVDIVFVIVYSCIINLLKQRMKSTISAETGIEAQISITCAVLVGALVSMTLPYAICVFVETSSNVYVSMLLVLNSGINTLVYFLRNNAEICSKNRTRNGNRKQVRQGCSKETVLTMA